MGVRTVPRYFASVTALIVINVNKGLPGRFLSRASSSKCSNNLGFAWIHLNAHAIEGLRQLVDVAGGESRIYEYLSGRDVVNKEESTTAHFKIGD